jgi:hypothetical protein
MHMTPPTKLGLKHVVESLVAPLTDAVLDRPHLPGHLEGMAELNREPLARLLRHRLPCASPALRIGVRVWSSQARASIVPVTPG